jgi:hypothetical protein
LFKGQLISVAFSAIILLLLTFSTQADSYSENFDSGSLSGNLVLNSSPGFSLSLSGGKAYFEKASGIGNGQVYLETLFTVVGDFSVTVKAERIQASSDFEMGLLCGDAAAFADIFFFTALKIHANIIIPPINTFQGVWNSSAEVTLRIRRVGNQMLEEYDAGSGFQLLNTGSHPNLSGPAKIRLFLLQEYGDTGYNLGTFDNLEITADRFEYPPISVQPTSWGRIKQLFER